MLIFCIPQAVAYADDDDSEFVGDFGNGSITIDGSLEADGGATSPTPPRPPAGPGRNGGNGPIVKGPGVGNASDVTPPGRQRGSDEEVDEVERLWGVVDGAEALLCAVGGPRYCPSSSESSSSEGSSGTPAGGEDVGEFVPAVTTSDFQVLPIKAPTLATDLDGFGLRGGVTNVYATDDVQTVTTTVLGQSVEVSAKPVSWRFDYGDGSAVNVSSSSGGPLPEQVLADPAKVFETDTATSHRYQQTGTYSIGLVTEFRGEYRVGGGGWVSIPGSTTVASEPITMDIWRTTSLHVSGPCGPRSPRASCSGPATR